MYLICTCLFPTADLSQVWPEANQHFSKEIDDEANSYFQRIYNHPPHPTMSVDEVSLEANAFISSIIKLLAWQVLTMVLSVELQNKEN